MSMPTKSDGNVCPACSTGRRTERPTSLDGSYIVDQNNVPLARVLSWRDRLTTKVMWSRGSQEVSSEGPSSARSVLDVDFQNNILLGLNRRDPDKSLSLLKGRRKGTMSLASESVTLPRSAEDVRRRQEHVDRGLVQTPVLFSHASEIRGEVDGIALVREAFLSELRDLYTILSSIDARKFDICRSDIHAMFEWFASFENFTRLYFVISETAIYEAGHLDEWENLRGVLLKESRKHEKKKIVELCDRVEKMKRVLISGLAHEKQKDLRELKVRVDEFTVRLVHFLDAEVEQVVEMFNGRFSKKKKDGLFHAMVNDMCNCTNGRDMVVVLAKGLGKDSNAMGRWLVETCEKANRAAVQKWMRNFVERHANYVKLFAKAESEYRKLYKTLGGCVDEEIEEIRVDLNRIPERRFRGGRRD